MKKALFILSLLIWTIKVNAAQVNGVAKIASASDHSGIKVKFIPITPSAKLDSTLTNADGYFSIDLLLGGYDIEYSIETAFNSTEDVFITTEQILPEVTLNHYRTISGIISGELTAGIPYHVTDDLTIECGDTLIINAGSRILIEPEKQIIVEGVLLAIGTEYDSIYFDLYNQVDNQTNLWAGIIFNRSTSTTSSCNVIKLDYTSILNAEKGIGNLYALDPKPKTLILNHSKILNCQYALSVGENTVQTIQNCFINCRLSSSEGCTYAVNDNTFMETSLFFISDPIGSINNNLFFNSHIEITHTHFIDTALVIKNNVFLSEKNDIYGIYLNSMNGIYIYNNIISGYQKGIHIYDLGFNININENIFYNNVLGLSLTHELGTPSIKYNAFFKNQRQIHFSSNTEIITGLGTRLTVNSNGDSTDFYNNVIDYDPLFISEDPEDENFFKVYAGSPVINAGVDGGNIGPEGIYYENVLSFSQTDNNTKHIYPNPTTGKVNFHTNQSFQIFNQQGTMVISENAKSTDLSSFEPGIYLIKTEGKTFKLIKE